MLFTSLQRLFECGSWIHDTKDFHFLMKHFGKDYLTLDDEPLSFAVLLKLTSLEFAIDCTSSRPDLHRIWREFSIWCCQPFVPYITAPACISSLKVAEKFTAGVASVQQLVDAYQEAVAGKFDERALGLSLEDCANSLSCEAANPNIEQSIHNCFNCYALGMRRLGMTIKRAEELQLQKFRDLLR
jgi:hypothetical protein